MNWPSAALLLVLLTACAPLATEDEIPSAGDAAVWLSEDGSSWERVTDPSLGGPGGQQLTAVVVHDGALVALGFSKIDGDSDGAVWISGNGRRWERITDEALGGPGSQVPLGLRVTGFGLIAVGFEDDGRDLDGVVWQSDDGRDWQRLPLTPSFAGRGSQGVHDAIEYRGSLIVAGADESNAAIWTSADGRSWERVPGRFDLGGDGDQVIRRLVATGDGLLAVGWDDQDAAVWASPDGESWSQVANPFVFGGDGFQAIEGVIATPDGLVAVGSIGHDRGVPLMGGTPERVWDAAVWRSDDGVVWTRVVDAGLEGPGSQSMIDVTMWGSTLVVTGMDEGAGSFTGGVWVPSGDEQEPDGAVWLSPDGDHWRKVRHPVLGGEAWQEVMAAVSFGDLLVAVGGDDREGA